MDKKLIGIALLILLLGIALGRYTAPEKVKVEHEVVTVTKESDKTNSAYNSDTDRNKHKEVVVTETTRPDGTKEKTTKTVEDSNTERKTEGVKSSIKTVDSTTATKDTKEVISKSGKLMVNAFVGANLFSPSSGLLYGGEVSHSLLGPINIGAWALTNKTAGFSLGFSF